MKKKNEWLIQVKIRTQAGFEISFSMASPVNVVLSSYLTKLLLSLAIATDAPIRDSTSIFIAVRRVIMVL